MSDHELDHQLDHQLDQSDQPARPGDHRATDDELDLDDYLDSEIDVDLEGDRWAVHGPPGERWGSEAWDPRHGLSPARRRVTHLVLVDGLPADHWVDESADAAWSRRAGPRGVSGNAARFDPPHVRELRWLESLVGGRSALMSLDTAGLVTPPR